jgi:hypothetical protein
MIGAGVMLGIGSGFQEMGFACIMEFIPNKYRLTALGERKPDLHLQATADHM